MTNQREYQRIYESQRRMRHAQNGRCYRCGGVLDTVKTRCSSCIAKEQATYAKHHDVLADGEKPCQRCGKVVWMKAHSKLCDECRIAGKRRRWNRVYEKRKRERICMQCGLPLQPDCTHVTCDLCRKIRSMRRRERCSEN